MERQAPAIVVTLLLAMAIVSVPKTAAAQEQRDLDKITKKCGLKKGKLQIKGERIVLFAEKDDSFQSMGCTRAELSKIPGAVEKLGIALGASIDQSEAK